MKKYAPFLILTLLAAALLAAATVSRRAIPEQPAVEPARPTQTDAVERWDRVIAYVPLDDRTDNMENLIYAAEASGYQILLPEGDVYCTKLDGQTPNANGTQYGDREALFTWVREMDAQGCDLFLLSLDQLMSGGLVNSRCTTASLPLRFEDGVLTEEEAFDRFILALGEDPENRVYLFDSVVRLSPTVGYNGFGADVYYALRQYGMVPRPALHGAELTLEQIFETYPYAADGVTPAEEALGDETYAHVLTDELIETYLAARRRKLTLLDHVMRALSGADGARFHLLIGIDDSSNTENIQYNELAYITRSLGENTILMAGLDSLARLLVGQIARDAYDYQVKAHVRYIGGAQDVPSSEYDLYNLHEVVDLHMRLYQAIPTDEANAELQILVMTAPDDPEKAQDYCAELIERLLYNQEHHRPTVLIEASSNAYGEALEQALLGQVDLGQLVAFAGKYDQANVTGAGFAMGFSRYLYLRCCADKTAACDEAQVRQLTHSAALTYGFTIHGRYPLNLFVKDLGYNYDNILATPADARRIREKMAELVGGFSAGVLENLNRGSVLCALEPWTTKRISGVTLSEFYFPWNRTFEVSFAIHVDPLQD